MKIVQLYPLHHGKVTLVDDPDFERVSQFRWTASLRLRANGDELTWYALRNYRAGGQQHCVLLHRFITSAAAESVVDHRDSNGLNNQRSNLRVCQQSHNLQNMRDRPGSSQYKGVSWHKQERCWRATIKVAGRQLHLGLFADEITAAFAYDAAARRNFGEFARTNFAVAWDFQDPRRSKSSSYRGVSRCGAASPKWRAHIRVDKRLLSLGTFSSEIEAASAYNAAAVAHFGERAKLNAMAGGRNLTPEGTP